MCDGVNDMMTTEGVLTSYMYPENYLNDMDCSVTITAGDGLEILLTFTDFQIEQALSNRCPDYLAISNGDSYLGNFCGDDIPDDIMSSGQNLLLRFKSDGSSTYRGFHARVTFIQGM